MRRKLSVRVNKVYNFFLTFGVTFRDTETSKNLIKSSARHNIAKDRMKI